MAAAARPGDRGRFAGLMVDRIGLIAPRIAALEPDAVVRQVNVLAGLRIGLNIVDLRGARHGFPPQEQDQLDMVLRGLVHHYTGKRHPRRPRFWPAR